MIAVADEGSASSTSAMIAPGTDVPTTLPGSRWATVTGSSYAAAHVSGLLALIVELRVELRVDPRSRAGGFASNPADSIALRDDRRVDACASLARAAQRCVCDCEQAAVAGSIARH